MRHANTVSFLAGTGRTDPAGPPGTDGRTDKNSFEKPYVFFIFLVLPILLKVFLIFLKVFRIFIKVFSMFELLLADSKLQRHLKGAGM